MLWPIVLSESAVATPGLPTSGGMIVDFKVEVGQVQVSSLRSEGSLLCGLLEQMNAFEMSVILIEFLQRLSAVGKKGQWSLRQLVWHFGAALEGALISSTPVENVVLAGEVMEARKSLASEGAGPSQRVHDRDRRRAKMKVRMSVKPAMVHGFTGRIAKYFFAARSCFQKPHHLTMAVDAGRVGKIDYMCGVIGLPSGHVAWLPPQAFIALAVRLGAHKEFNPQRKPGSVF